MAHQPRGSAAEIDAQSHLARPSDHRCLSVFVVSKQLCGPARLSRLSTRPDETGACDDPGPPASRALPRTRFPRRDARRTASVRPQIRPKFDCEHLAVGLRSHRVGRVESFQSGALVRGAGGFCCVAIEQYAVEGHQSVGSAVDASAPVVERVSDAADCEGRLLATMPETVEASADELAPAL